MKGKNERQKMFNKKQMDEKFIIIPGIENYNFLSQGYEFSIPGIGISYPWDRKLF